MKRYRIYYSLLLLILAMSFSTAEAQTIVWKNGSRIFSTSETADSMMTVLPTGYLPKTEYEDVDLGLPSGTLWGNMNMKAKNEFDFGTWIPLFWNKGKEAEMRSSTYITPENDYVTVNKGKEWCTPSFENFEELLEYCKCDLILGNVSSGYVRKIFIWRLTGPNGNFIFLPADTNRLSYFSSTLDGGNENCKSHCISTIINNNCFEINFNYIYGSGCYRPVRVQKKQ